MNEVSNLNSAISLDLKKYRIRIHKATVHLIGDPKYIQLLVNPEDMAMAIRSVDVTLSGDQTHRVNQRQMKSDNSFEIYSRAFVEKLCQVRPDLEPGRTYRLTGKVIPKERVAVYSLLSMKPVIN